MDLTLPIGFYGEQITIRKLEVAECRRSRYSGRLEYKLSDSGQSRIDYTRWFEETDLSQHDSGLPDPVCKRVLSKGRGKPCTATPTFPSGLCIKHKAKLDWDREKQRVKLEAELKQRDEAKESPRESIRTAITATSDSVTDLSRLSQSTTLVIDVE